MTVFVKFQDTYEEWGETWVGEVLGVFSEEGVKEDIKKYLPDAREYVDGQLFHYRRCLKDAVEKRDSTKEVVKTLSQEDRENPNNHIVKMYAMFKREVSHLEQYIKVYKTAQKSDLETVKTYLWEKRHIEYQEREVIND